MFQIFLNTCLIIRKKVLFGKVKQNLRLHIQSNKGIFDIITCCALFLALDRLVDSLSIEIGVRKVTGMQIKAE